jgi:hypothetical protein
MRMLRLGDTPQRFSILAAAMTGAILAASPALAAVLAPYSNDFTTDANDFTLSTAAGGWTLSTSGTGTLTHSAADLPSGNVYAASVQVTNLGGSATTDFGVSGRYTATAGAGSFTYVGLAALADSDTLSNTYYLVRQRMGANSGNLQIIRVVNRSAATVLSETAERLSFHFNDLHELILSGVYVDTDSNGSPDALDLTVTLKNLTDGTQWTTATFRDTSPLTGQFFGMRDANANNDEDFAVAWDLFSVDAVPEPGSLMLLVVGMALAFSRPSPKA